MRISGATLEFEDEAGEANDVSIETDAPVFRVIDNTAVLTAGAGCSQRSTHRVNCPTAGITLVQAVLGSGDDTIQTLVGTVDADLRGGPGSDSLQGSDGDDTLSAGKGRISGGEILSGGFGSDVLMGSPSFNNSVAMDGGPGADALLGGNGGDTLLGNVGPDLLVGGQGFDQVFWLAAGVTVTAGAGANDGEPGENDDLAADVEIISGTNGPDNISGGPANNLLLGNGGKDVLNGESGNDRLDGDDGGDTLNGGDGDDDLAGALRADDISGGAGIDKADYSDHAGAVNVTINDVANDGGGGGSEGDNVHTDVENLVGGDGGDTLIGSAEDNTITGEEGDDEIQGLAGEDDLFGDASSGTSTVGVDELHAGPGDDTMMGGPAADSFDGGADIDVADYGRMGPLPDVTVSIDNVANDGTGGGAEGDNVTDTTEGVVGGNGNDTLVGNSAANTLFGGPGNDTLQAGSGRDLMDGENPAVFAFIFGADVFMGGSGSDTVTYASHGFSAVQVDIGGGPDGFGAGNEGDDVQSSVENLIGAEGGDTLTGNDQANSLAGRGGSDTLNGGGAADHLAGNSGQDVHSGQGGKDEINSRADGSSDNDNCGSEADTAIADSFDLVNPDCETVIP